MVKIIERPRRVTILALLSFWISIWNGVRLVEAIVFWKTLKSYGINPLYIAISGGTWLISGVLLGLGMWRGKVWSWAASFGGAVGFASWYWFDRLVFQEPRTNWPFALGLTVFSLLFVALILLTHPTRKFLKKSVL
jgi:hypothetical protein